MTENTFKKDLVKTSGTVVYSVVPSLFEVIIDFQVLSGDRLGCCKLLDDPICVAVRNGVDFDGSAWNANRFHQLTDVISFTTPFVEVSYLFPILETDKDSDDVVDFYEYRCFGDSFPQEERSHGFGGCCFHFISQIINFVAGGTCTELLSLGRGFRDIVGFV